MFTIRTVGHISDDAFVQFFKRIECISMCLSSCGDAILQV